MRRLVLSVGFAATVSGLLTGCEVESPDLPGDEPTKADQKPILGGSQDTAHDAVVLVLSDGGFACSGTIIAKNGTTGYVLTAAHCDSMDWVIMDDDTSCLNNNTCDGVWQVEQQIDHPDWNPNDVAAGYDFSLIRFSGANGSTPVIPAAAPSDGVQVGTMTDMVGYGVTEFGSTDLRMHVVQPVDQTTSIFLAWDQTGGTGTCSGDSGGPALFNGEVVGVTSYGDEGCQQIGVSGRVAAVYNDFIAPFIGGQVTETCDSCFDAEVNQPTGQCAPQVNACFEPETNECAVLVDCLNGCPGQICINNCFDDHPGGVAAYDAIFDCSCVACAGPCEDRCDSGNPTTAVVSSSGNGLMGTGGMAGVGGAGSGGTSSEGGNNGEGGGDNAEDGDASGPCDCATAGSNVRSPGGSALGLAGLALALGALRRRGVGRRRR